MKGILAFLLLGSLGVATPAAAEGRVLARVAGEPITSDRVARDFGERHSGHTRFLLGESEIRRFLDQVIDNRLLIQEAYRLELDAEPEIVAAVAQYRSQQAAEELVAEEIDARVEVTDAEVRGIWENELGQVRDVLEIVVASEAEARDAAGRLAAGEDFEALARELSTARSKLHGGRVPPVGWGSRDPDWERAVFALEPGQTSEPFAAEGGWVVARLLGVREVERPDFERARGRIRALLERRRLDARRAEFGTELWAKYSARLVPGLDLRPESLASLRAQAPQTPIASWDGGELSLERFLGELDLDGLAGREDAEVLLEQLLRRTVNGALAAVEAKARGLDAKPELDARTLEVREILMQGALLTDYLLRGVEVTDDEVRAWYESHREDFRIGERRRTSHIVVGSREEAEQVRSRLERGEEFGQLAREVSSDKASARSGGDLGWVAVDEIPAEMAAVAKLPVGGISEPIETRYGWHVIRVTELDPPRQRPYEEVEAELRPWLLEREKTLRRRQWIERLRESTEIVIDDDAIAAFAADNRPGSEE